MKRSGGVRSIFLAVSRAPRGPFSGYLANCAIHEFDELGAPLSMTSVPQVVQGHAAAVVLGGIVWRCKTDSFLRVAATDRSGIAYSGPGGPDLSMEVPWFRHASPLKVPAWLTTDRSGDPVAFSPSHALCVPAGGYVPSEGVQVFRFPLSAVSLETGLDRPFMLNVPFEGSIALPSSNLSRTQGLDGRETVHVLGPWLLAVTQLRIEGSRLLVTLGMESTSSIVEFDLSGSELVRSPVADSSQAKLLRERVAALGDINRTSEDGKTLLFRAASGEDLDYLKALLAAGADPKARSRTDWTPLMTAALYGNAAAVEVLIQAGSDLNAHESAHGGQTVLMWAARSQVEAGEKVRLLLRAGADPKGSAENGWNALLSAASSGNLPAVEALLEAGLDVNYRTKDGTTALLAAAGAGSAPMVNLLCALGADRTARDAQGRTALHLAAEGGCLSSAKALLAEGADPSLKDAEGRTPLDAARGAQRFASKAVAEIIEEAILRAAAPRE